MGTEALARPLALLDLYKLAQGFGFQGLGGSAFQVSGEDLTLNPEP